MALTSLYETVSPKLSQPACTASSGIMPGPFSLPARL
jgi:hypothetical protein